MGVIQDAMGQLIQMLQADVIGNVVATTHTDYTEFAELPAFVLLYPEIEDYRPNEMNERRVEKIEGGTTIIRPPKVFKNLLFEYEILSTTLSGPSGLAQIQESFIAWSARNRVIDFGGILCDVHTTDPTRQLYTPNLSNVKRIEGMITIQGIEIESGVQEEGNQVLNREFETTKEVESGEG